MSFAENRHEEYASRTPTFVPHHTGLLPHVKSSSLFPTSLTRNQRVRLPSYTQKTRRAQSIQLCTESKSATPVPLAPLTSDVWELDFYSRPVVGLDGKKLWELIITDATGTFEYIDAVPNTMVNSRELRKRIEAAIDTATRKPTTIRFFRSQMLNMIQIALSEIDVAVFASRKTYALYKLLKYRETNVYCKMPGYKASLAQTASATAFTPINFTLAKRLPDALRCEKFAFGNFPLVQLKQFFEESDPKDYFGDSCLVDEDLSDETLIPGLIVFSKRAPALSAWISGVELAFIKVLLERREVVLECGLDSVYLFAQILDDLKDDVRAFQKLKESAKGLHFLAVQKSPDSDEIDGMWMMSEL